MPVKDFKKFLEIAKVCNRTFGTSPEAKSATEAVILKAVDDEMLSAMFVIVVSYTTESMWNEMRKRWLEEGIESTKAALSDAEERFKEATGKAISFKLMPATVSDNMEVINFNSYTGLKKAYFRVISNAKID